MTVKDIKVGGQVIDMLGTYCQADLDCFDELPFVVREYMRNMIAPPRSAIVLQSVQQCGIRATMLALREHDMMMRISGTVH